MGGRLFRGSDRCRRLPGKSGSELYRKTNMVSAGRSENAALSGASGSGTSGSGTSGETIESQLIGELLGLLAHDLRNPLSALHSNLGYLDTVLSSHDDEAREAVEDGVVSCDGLSHVIDN